MNEIGIVSVVDRTAELLRVAQTALHLEDIHYVLTTADPRLKNLKLNVLRSILNEEKRQETPRVRHFKDTPFYVAGERPPAQAADAPGSRVTAAGRKRLRQLALQRWARAKKQGQKRLQRDSVLPFRNKRKAA